MLPLSGFLAALATTQTYDPATPVNPPEAISHMLGILAETLIKGRLGRYARMRRMERQIADDLLGAIGTHKQMSAAQRPF
jgi:hypothetical protein